MESPIQRVGKQTDPGYRRNEDGQTVIEQATVAMQNLIMRGRYAPGQRLVEADLTRELKISRGSVREVLRRLQTDGLVSIEAYRGAVVAPLSREGLRNAFDVREVIEGLGARVAAERFARGDFPSTATEKKLREWAETGSGDQDEYMDRNVQFHNFIAELSGNPYLLPLLTQMQLATRRTHFATVMSRQSIEASMKEHLEVVDAICNGDPVRAERTMRRHIRRTAKLAERLPDYLFFGSAD